MKMENLAKNLRSAMTDKGYDQVKLSEVSKVGQGTISRILNAEGEARESTLSKLGRALGKTTAELRGYVSLPIDTHNIERKISGNQLNSKNTMTSELIARMYGITNTSIIVILEKLLTLNDHNNQIKALSDIKLRIDFMIEELEIQQVNKKERI